MSKKILYISSKQRNILKYLKSHDFRIDLPERINNIIGVEILSLKCGCIWYGKSDGIDNDNNIDIDENYLSFIIKEFSGEYKSNNPAIQKSFGLIDTSETASIQSNIVPKKVEYNEKTNINTITLSVLDLYNNHFNVYDTWENHCTSILDKYQHSGSLANKFKNAFFETCLKIYSIIWSDNTCYNSFGSGGGDDLETYCSTPKSHFNNNFSVLEHIFNNSNKKKFFEGFYAEDIMWVLAFGNYQREVYLKKLSDENIQNINYNNSIDNSSQNCYNKQEKIALKQPDIQLIDSFYLYDNIYKSPLKGYIKTTTLDDIIPVCNTDIENQLEVIIELDCEKY